MTPEVPREPKIASDIDGYQGSATVAGEAHGRIKGACDLLVGRRLRAMGGVPGPLINGRFGAVARKEKEGP